MEWSEHLAALERDGRAVAASCAAAPRGARVAACPEWDVDDLLWHLTEVHWFWRSIVEQRAQDWRDVGELARPPADEVPGLYASGLDRLVDVLRSTEATTPVWTWTERHDVGWIVRRMAQETAVHRWDADSAAGTAQPIEAHLASDGIDEFLEHFLQPGEGRELSGSVHIHCSDVPGEWLVAPGDPLVVTREHAKGAAAMRGTASDLLLALWQRVPLESIDVVGERAAAESLLALARRS